VITAADATLPCENISIKLRCRADDIGDFDLVGVDTADDLEGVDDFLGDLDLMTVTFGDRELDGVEVLEDDPCCFDGVDINSLAGDEADEVISCFSGVKVTPCDFTGVEALPLPALFTRQPVPADADTDSLDASKLPSTSSLLPFLSTSTFSGDAAVNGL